MLDDRRAREATTRLVMDQDSERTRADARMEHDQCGVCHQVMEGAGLTFDRFDGFGRLRDEDERGNALTNRGQLMFGFGQEPRQVSGPPELVQTLLESDRLKRCTARTFYTAIEGTDPPAALPEVETIREILTDVDGGFKEQLVALVRAETFRTRVR